MNQRDPNLSNRRRSRRSGVRGQARVECRKGSLGLGPNLAVTGLDISETGIRLILKATLEIGQEVEIVLSGLGLNRPLKRPGKVVWSLALEDGRWCAGVSFEKALRYADVQNLGRASA